MHVCRYVRTLLCIIIICYLDNRESSGFSVFYFLPIKDWYFLSITISGIDLDTIAPLAKTPEANKRIIFVIWTAAVGLQSPDCEALWNIFTEKCSMYRELEQKFGGCIASYLSLILILW